MQAIIRSAFSLRLLVSTLLVAVALTSSISPSTASESEKSARKTAGSIQLSEKQKSVELPGLTKISFEQALKAAQIAAPGKVIKAELEVEGGCLMYSFEIVTAEKTVKEVEIDAGTGKVLDIDND